MSAGHNTGAAKLRAYIERIERIEADIKDMNADKSEVYKELRGQGYDVKAVRAVVAKRKLDTAEREERDAIFDLYWHALTGSPRVHVHTHTHEEAPEASDRSVPPIDPPAPAGSAPEEIPAPIDEEFEPPEFIRRGHEFPELPEILRRSA
jgi:uncharacterized protein (UPF0335 family)